MSRAGVALLCATMGAGCATLGQLSAFVRAPQFQEAPDQPAEIRLLPPSQSNGLGGAGLRVWTKVTNPNPFGFTLARLEGTLFLDDVRAATADFPLGLPLGPRGDAVVPIDLSIDFSDLPQLTSVMRQLLARQSVAYRLEGTVGVNAGTLGTPVFGPMTIVKGDAKPPRLPQQSR